MRQGTSVGSAICNDIGCAISWLWAELYAGMDHGQAGSRSTVDLLGRSLVGAVIGVRGQWNSCPELPHGQDRLSFNLNTGF